MQKTIWRLSVTQLLLTILLVLAVTAIGRVFSFDIVNVALCYILPVLISAVLWGRAFSLFAAVLSVLIFDFFFVPPAFGFRPDDPRDFVILAIFLIVAVVTGTIATRLRNERERLRALASRLESIREEERSRIAREIHDELGQALTGLKIDLLRLSRRLTKDQEGLVGEIHAMGKLIDNEIQIIRKISSELRPGILDDLGLVSTIEWHLEDFKKRTEIQAEFVTTLEDRNLNRDLSTALFRILQETLTNVIRHAQATYVKVSIKEDAGDIVLTVEDNGKGIPDRAAFDPKALGLLGIRERALIYGGELQVTGSKGRGTKIAVKIPLREAQKHHA
ncbi:MAG: sensor histidine kinase [Deltaproteobacteria bacterium]|nr:sensor histidine kinase [Deltaproteobacteria bacterium]